MPSIADTPVYIDDNVPTTDTAGSGSAQDIAISALWDERLARERQSEGSSSQGGDK
jgi:hypothetical protein